MDILSLTIPSLLPQWLHMCRAPDRNIDVTVICVECPQTADVLPLWFHFPPKFPLVVFPPPSFFPTASQDKHQWGQSEFGMWGI